MHDQSIQIESLDMEARGVGRTATEDGSSGKVIFVEGALPGETVSYTPFRRKARWEAATLVEIHKRSPLRVEPKCAYFGVCGGCAMQHLDPAAQVAVKQRVLEDNLRFLGSVKPDTMLAAIHGPAWEYRYRARISVRNVAKKGGILIGFHERRSSYVADMKTCEILPRKVSRMLVPMRELFASLSVASQLPQVELAVGEREGTQVIVMVLRIMAPLNAQDESLLRTFADRHGVEWWLQPKGPDTAYPFYPETSALEYCLPEFGIRVPFKPTDFTQVNHQINQVLVSRAVRLLDVLPQHRVGDMFCGLGNFTLALATRASEVVGIEGSTALVERARENAAANRLQDRTSFQCRNLFELTTDDFVALGRFDRLLIDPPRDGAMAMCEAIAGLQGELQSCRPERIVYVSCNPATLARDAAILVQKAGYRLSKAGVVNMFPHTAHVESIAVFDLAEPARR